MRLNPFRAVRPAPELAAQVAAVPYDVVNRAEAEALARGNPRSFLHVGRSDIDLPADVDPYDARVYAQARTAFERFLADGTLRRDASPTLYLYRQEMDGRAQTGIVGCVHIDDYERDVIRKHEKTRPDKEDDRTRHVLTLRANAEPVFLTYRGHAGIDRLVEPILRTAPLYDFVAPDGVRHAVWQVPQAAPLVEAFRGVSHAYVADGHHRSASAWRAGKELRGSTGRGRERLVSRGALPRPRSPDSALQSGRPRSQRPRRNSGAGPALGCRAGHAHRRSDAAAPRGALLLPGGQVVSAGARRVDDRPRRYRSARSTCALLQDRILGPILGIGDPRTDKRIDFVGGIRGPSELERRVESGEMAIAFSLFPTTLEQLMAVSDAGQIMPPKSTWFEPKLRSGLFVHEI